MFPVRPALVNSPLSLSTEAPSGGGLRSVNMSEMCSEFNVNVERQLLSYVAGIEAITGTIQELDEVVQQMRPAPRSCDQLRDRTEGPSSTGGPNVGLHNAELNEFAGLSSSQAPESMASTASSELSTTSTITNRVLEMETVSADPGHTTTTEAFTDSPAMIPLASNERGTREVSPVADSAAVGFGMPASGHPPSQDQAGDDLTRVSQDLRALRRDLSSAADWLRQTNHTIHSAMFRALQAYVSSIERRIDHQRQLVVQTRIEAIKAKVVAIKELVANLINKLKAMISSKPGAPGARSYVEATTIGSVGVGSVSPSVVSTAASL